MLDRSLLKKLGSEAIDILSNLLKKKIWRFKKQRTREILVQTGKPKMSILCEGETKDF